MAAESSAPTGICFPAGGDGHRSTTATGRAIFADSARTVDGELAARIEHTANWRNGYPRPLRDLVRIAATEPSAAITIARDGLSSARRRMEFVHEGERMAIAEAMSAGLGTGLGSVTVRGSVDVDTALALPYHGRVLRGDDLRRQVDTWVGAGVAEPALASTIDLLIDNPDWFDLRGVDVAVLGASAEMGPTRSLLRWGARVHAVDLPRTDLWQRLIAATRASAGTLRVPIGLDVDGRPPFVVGGDVHPEDDATVAAGAGADLITQAPRIAAWLAEVPDPLVLGTYAYADGAAHVLLTVAADAIANRLRALRDDLSLAYLATPTDVFAVPAEAVAESRRRWDTRGIGGLLQAPLRLLRQFEPNYPDDLADTHGRPFGLCDALVTQQGPNYALAKRLQLWNALAARADGLRVSANLAPATRTGSVIRNRALAAAYSGAGRFGVEVFEPQTSTVLMAALLVHDLRNPAALADPRTPVENPMDLYTRNATHGGLWRAAYTPRSVLGIAAMLGVVEARS